MKPFFLAFLLFFTPLSATIVKPWTLEIDTGYREDSFNWRIQNKGDRSVGLVSEKYSDVRFLATRARLYTVYKDLYLSGNFDYAFLGRGDLQQKDVAGPETNANPSFTFTTTGHTYLAKITGGYQCNLTPLRYYQVVLTPLFGYSLTYEKLRRKPNNALYDTATIDIESNPGQPLTMHWSGPFLGLDLFMNPSGGFSLEIGYTHSWLYVHQSMFSQIRVKNFNSGGTLTNDRILTMKGKIKTGGALGQSGHVRAAYQVSQKWTVGVLGLIEYRSSNVEAVNITNRTETLVPTSTITETVISRNYKSRWTTVSALAEVDYTF